MTTRMLTTTENLCTAGNNFFTDFPTCVKLGVGSGSGSNEKQDPDPDRRPNDAAEPQH